MKRLVLTAVVLGLFVTSLIGCRAETEVEPVDQSAIPLAR
jgi:hypothetical protein